jgi:hypothetical protein
LKVKIVKKLKDRFTEYEALEDGTIVTSPGDCPDFGIKELEDMKLFIKKGQRFQLSEHYAAKNSLTISEVTKQDR